MTAITPRRPSAPRVSVAGADLFAVPVRSGAAAPALGVARPRLRLTRRGRRVVAILLTIPLIVLALILGHGAVSAVGTAEAGELGTYTVEGGETLWAIAGEIAPEADTRDVIAVLMQTNGLSTSEVVAGQQLLIPAQYAD